MDSDQKSVQTSVKDEGLSELLKQADALLDAHNTELNQSENPQRPTLPKKDTSLQTRGRSFDIIQSSNNTIRSRATLKTGSRDSGTSQNLESHTLQSRRPIFAAAPFDEEEQEVNPDESVIAENAQDESSESDITNTVAASQSQEGTHTSSEELYPSNLVKDARPKGYVPNPKQHNPIVFDTNEYHPALHELPAKAAGKGTSNRAWLTTLALGLGLIAGLIYLFLAR